MSVKPKAAVSNTGVTLDAFFSSDSQVRNITITAFSPEKEQDKKYTYAIWCCETLYLYNLETGLSWRVAVVVVVVVYLQKLQNAAACILIRNRSSELTTVLHYSSDPNTTSWWWHLELWRISLISWSSLTRLTHFTQLIRITVNHSSVTGPRSFTSPRNSGSEIHKIFGNTYS